MCGSNVQVYERHGAWMYLRINMDNGPLFPSPAMEDRTQNPKPKCQPHPSKYQIPEPQGPFFSLDQHPPGQTSLRVPANLKTPTHNPPTH